MGRLIADITMSLDGFVAGPNASLEHPLGEGGDLLHRWAVRLRRFREMHGMDGGETGPDDDVIGETFEANGAVIMGRRMFSGGAGPWAEDSNANGWWGDDPPFGVPVFVLTHHPREPLVMKGGTTFHFVADGISSALEQARAAAGDRNVHLGGGASAVQQYLEAGLLDELQVHVAPVLLHDGTRLFGRPGGAPRELSVTRVIESPYVTHIRYETGGER